MEKQQQEDKYVIKVEQNQQQEEEEEYEKIVQQKFREEVEHLSKPNWVTTQFVKKPFIVVSFCALFFVICFVLTVVAGLFKISEQNRRDFLIWSHKTVEIYDMIEEGISVFQDNMSENQMPFQSYNQYLWMTSLIIECDEDSNKNCATVIKPEIIQYLNKIETKIKNLPKYSQFCLASIDSTDCISQGLVSITPLFDNPSSATQEEVKTVTTDIVSQEDTFSDYKVLFHNQFEKEYQKSKIIRSVFQFGAPLNIDGKTYKDQYDEEKEQDDHFLDFSYDIEKVTTDFPPPSGYKIIPYSQVWAQDVENQQINADFAWAAASILFVWFYLTIHLRSLFLSSIGMFIIIISFPISLVILKGIFRVTYFSSLHILAVFIILGIAADDIFVFIDAWRQAKLDEQIGGDQMKMMAFTFRRASRAMLATSSTTAAAFFATGFSTLMPISSFGIFAGILVPVNYMLVIFFFSSVVIIYDKYIEGKCCQCCKKKQEKQQNSQEPVKKKESIIIRFFDSTFNNFIVKFKVYILILITIWIGIASWRTALLTPVTEQESFLPSSFKTQKAMNYLKDDFHKSAAIESTGGIEVSFFWGIKDISRDGVGKWESDNRGTIEWDDSFNLAKIDSQNYLHQFCIDAKDHSLVFEEQVECFILDFKDWLLQNSNEFPVPEDQFLQKLIEFTEAPEGISYYTDSQIGIIKGKLRFIQVFIKAKGELGLPSKQMEPIYDDWQEFKDKENKNSPPGLKNGHQTAGFAWVWMQSEKAFVTNAIQGMVISLIFAWVVLMLTTQNIIMSFYSVICIAGIVVSVVSIMELQGWELGISESITIVILIGLSVDYVVHLANHYVESVYPDRNRKMRVSLKEIGISIVSGAITTLGSGFFLFFAVLTTFNKFALLIVCTILFSLLFALFFFSALIHLWGPEGNTGNYYVFFKQLCNKKDKNKQENMTDTKSQQKQKVEQHSNLYPDVSLQQPQSVDHLRSFQSSKNPHFE